MKTNAGVLAGWIAVSMAAITTGCVGAELEDIEEGSAAAELRSDLAADLAYPEYDLNEPSTSAWSQVTDAAGVASRLSQGFRLVSIDTLSSAPLAFSATYVFNAGVYFRNGHGFDGDLTRVELEAIAADPARRVVDIAPYRVGTAVRYAAAWVGNTGAQQKHYQLVLGAFRQTFESLTSSFNGRITDLAILDGLLYGVMIESVDADRRTQWLGVGTRAEVVEAVALHRGRLSDLEPWAAGTFYYVVDETRGSTGEQTWWAADLIDLGVDKHDPDSLFHQPDRFGARYLKLKGYDTPEGRRYYGWLADNGVVLMKGTDNAGNATLAKIDAAVSRQMKRAGIPGATLAVVRNGQLVHAKGYGWSSLGAGRITEPTDMFRIASVSKAIAGVALLRLIQDGTKLPPGTPGAGQTITLDTRPWGQIWAYNSPGFSPNLGQITLRHLLEHSTGLSSRFAWLLSEIDFNEEELTEGAASFRHAPGQNVGDFYKNSHYHMLGEAVATITGGTFDQYVQRTLFEPLSIQRIRVSHPTADPDPPGLFQAINYDRPGRFARQYFDQNNQVADGATGYHGDGVSFPAARHAAGSYAASPIDLLRFAVSLDGSRAGVRSLDATRFGWIKSQRSSSLVGTTRYLTWFTPQPSDPSQFVGGYLPGITHAQLFLRPDGVMYAFMSNSDSMTNIATQISNREDFEGKLMAELDGILDAEATLLPARDFFDQYVPPPCFSDFASLQVAKFQACFNHWSSKGLSPQTLTVSTDGARISGSFQPIGPRRTHYLLDRTTYNAITQEELQNKTIPDHVNVVNVGGQPLYTATWVSTGGVGGVAVSAASPASFQGLVDQFYSEYRLTDWFPYQDGGLKMAASWRKQAGGGYAARYGLTWQALLDVNAAFLPLGLRITHCVAYTDGGQTLYAAIWYPVAGDWRLWNSASSANYQSVWTQMVSEGYGLHQVHSFGADSFLSIWKRNATNP